MKTIVILDDQDHAIKQIEHEFPQSEWQKYNFIHFDTYELFKKQKFNHIDVLFLDFFLSKDRIYGLDILESISSKILVCFSSKKEMSDAMANSAIKNGIYKFENVYSIKKIKESLNNSELNRILLNITKRVNDE